VIQGLINKQKAIRHPLFGKNKNAKGNNNTVAAKLTKSKIVVKTSSRKKLTIYLEISIIMQVPVNNKQGRKAVSFMQVEQQTKKRLLMEGGRVDGM
jgi:hypothetical protein